MRYFPEIIRVLDRFREKRVETLDGAFRRRTDDKAFLLYDGIRTGIFGNDSVAAGSLYQTRPNDPRYTTLKARLKIRLLNSLFHLNLRKAGFSESAQAEYSAKKRAFLIHTLVRLGARKAAVSLAKRNLDEATKYEITDIGYEMALLLRTNAGINARLAEYESYDQILKGFLANLNDEAVAWEYFDRQQIILGRYAGGRARFAPQFLEYALHLRSLLRGESSFTFRLNYYRVLGNALGAAGKHMERVAEMDGALMYLRSIPHLAQPARLAEFKLQQVDSFLRVRRYEEAEKAAEECLTLFNAVTISWFTLRELQFVILTNRLRFLDALDIYLEVTSHQIFPNLPEAMLERWRIYEYYLHYAFEKTGTPEAARELRMRFKVDTLMQMVPMAGRDKVGMNVALRILQIIYLLEGARFKDIFDRMESLNLYRARYLVAKSSKASSIFLKMLRIMEANSFGFERSRRQAARYYHQLQTETFEIVDSEMELEILPFTWLWDRILERLEAIENNYELRMTNDG
ncbi:MAG: hypothetical protein Q8922_09440 [Bacteroidota bacterium]|nr:hypothetical protein [Bacteroidota bacterium]MDP4234415.1 hypothetical protein [Bacteroidota bacterium]MDP4243981.1 hypothetical protein [Bacteroidota bacterium]MDP4288147.1 hypothetical protein [Bacteroidota bacterium]